MTAGEPALSPLQRAALAAARLAVLRKFRVGWAHDKTGPFHSRLSVAALERRGLLRIGPRVARVPRQRRRRQRVADGDGSTT